MSLFMVHCVILIDW